MSKKSNTTIPHGTGKPSTHSTYTIHQSPEIHGEMPRFSNVPPPPSPKKNNMEIMNIKKGRCHRCQNATTSQEKIEILIKLRGTVTKMKVLEVSNL